MTVPTRTRPSDARAFGDVDGLVLGPGEPGFEESTRLWNTRHRAVPRMVVRPRTIEAVTATVRAARDADLTVTVRGAGHHVAGSAVRDGGLVVDLRGLRSVRLSADGRTIRVGAGCTWYDVNVVALPHGRSVPAGNSSSTGVVGLTLGGGIGPFTRPWGLTCDRLTKVGLVDADGRYRIVDQESDPELLWALRGAGRGLGVVTSLEFDTCPIGQQVATVQAHHAATSGVDLIEAWVAAALASPRDVGPQVTIRTVPRARTLDERIAGRTIISVGVVYAGEPAAAAGALQPWHRLGTPLLDHSGTYPVLERPLPWRPDLRAHSGGYFLTDLSTATIRRLLAAFGEDGTPGASVTVRLLGGAVQDVDPRTSAFAHRPARFLVVVQREWTDPAEDGTAIAWCDAVGDTLVEGGSVGIYGNFTGHLSAFRDQRSRAYGDTGRIDAVRARVDPDGFFHEAAMRP